MSHRDLAQETLDQAFSTMGEAATYQAMVGGSLQAGVAITVMSTTRDNLATFDDVMRVRAETFFDVRVSEVASPTLNGLIIINGVNWRIAGTPHRRDRYGLIWMVGCNKAS